LGHVRREYPHKLDHVMRDARDVRGPRQLHPVFHGSFDWHSCVHGYWLLATVLRRYPTQPESVMIRALFDEQLTEAKLAAELEYIQQPMRGGFERPYGWAWMLMLAAEIDRHENADGSRWHAALEPLANTFARRFADFLPRATYPVRVGTHYNTAFALRLVIEYADEAGDHTLAASCRAKAVEWYEGDADCQAWEPSGDDFLSSALIEAECMRAVLSQDRFASWLDRFLPRLASREPATLFTPADVSDRSDGKIAHLDGLNLSRAWCWRSIAFALDVGDPRRAIALGSAEEHLAASLSHVSGDYAGEHWLATFACLALMA
jgi:Protein of unknown function (DUF2891).